MKKILLSMAIVLIAAFSVNAQSYILSQHGLVLGDTMTFFADSAGASEIIFSAAVTNNTGHTSEVMVARNVISGAGESVSQICWAESCFPPDVDTVGPQTMESGAISGEEDFAIHYIVNGAVGVSVIEFIIYDKNNPSEVSKIVAKFDPSPDGINENILKNIWLSDVYPNPATNFVVIDYKLPSEIDNASAKIVNLLGSIVKEQEVNIHNTKMRMDVSDLNSGIYFYSLTVNGDIYSTKKLVIR
jgi:hypothetical protein